MLAVYLKNIHCAFQICSMLFKKTIAYLKMFKVAAVAVAVALYMQPARVRGASCVSSVSGLCLGASCVSRVAIEMCQVNCKLHVEDGHAIGSDGVVCQGLTCI